MSEPDWQALSEARYINLSTYRKSGIAVDTPVWGAPLQGAIYVFSEAKAGKVKRLRNSARSRLAVCDARGGLKSDWKPTSAFLVSDAKEIQQAQAAFTAKYGLVMRLTDFFSRLTGRYNARAYIRVERLADHT